MKKIKNTYRHLVLLDEVGDFNKRKAQYRITLDLIKKIAFFGQCGQAYYKIFSITTAFPIPIAKSTRLAIIKFRN